MSNTCYHEMLKNAFLIISFVLISFLSQAQETRQRINYTVSVNSKIGEISMSKEELKNAKVGVHTFNVNDEGKVVLKNFTLKCPGQNPLIVNGEVMSSDANQK